MARQSEGALSMITSQIITGHFFGYTPLWEVVLRLVLAAALAAAIGYDREIKNRPAGLRTHMLTSIAAAVFTILTLEIAQDVSRISEAASVDPARVIQAVTAGVAFLAAGAIIQSGGKIHGLTTGAGMWMAGALGVACGAGYYFIATLATVLTFVVLSLVHRLEERWINASSPTDNSEKD